MKLGRQGLSERDVTPEALWLRRREFLRASAALSLAVAGCLRSEEGEASPEPTPGEVFANLKPAPPGPLRAEDEATPFDIAQAHAADEWVALSQLDEVAGTYLRIMGGAK